VLIIVLYIRSPSKKRGRSTWLNARTDRTTSLCLARINVSEPSSIVMDIDGIMKAVKKLLLTKSMQESSNKLRNSQSLKSFNFTNEFIPKQLILLDHRPWCLALLSPRLKALLQREDKVIKRTRKVIM